MRNNSKVFIAIAFTFFTTSFVMAASDDAGLRMPESQEVSSNEFLSSDATRYFQAGDFGKALVAFNQLARSFPKDELIKRYQAMTLDRLGKSKEAIQIFKQLLEKNPHHAPTHYFLGQAYARSGFYEEATREWKSAVQEGAGTSYAVWSQNAIQRSSGPDFSAAQTPDKIDRWYIQAKYGYEYDTNVVLRPDDKALSASTDQTAGRQSADLVFRYRALSKRHTAVDFIYAVRQSVHDDHLEAYNYHSEEFGGNVRQRVKIGNQDVILGARYDYSLGFLSTDLYSNRNRWNFSADTHFTEHTQTIFSDRMTITNYGPDGFEPSRTSRDGFENDVGVTQIFYNDSFQNYFFAKSEFNTASTRGSNYDSLGVTHRVGFHAPIPKLQRFSFDISSGMRNACYPNFTSTSTLAPRKRVDLDWDIYTSLTFAVTRSISLRGFYSFVKTENNNNIYEYHRNIGGLQLVYSRNY